MAPNGPILPICRLGEVFFKKTPEKQETALKWILNYDTIKYTGIFLFALYLCQANVLFSYVICCTI